MWYYGESVAIFSDFMKIIRPQIQTQWSPPMPSKKHKESYINLHYIQIVVDQWPKETKNKQTKASKIRYRGIEVGTPTIYLLENEWD